MRDSKLNIGINYISIDNIVNVFLYCLIKSKKIFAFWLNLENFYSSGNIKLVFLIILASKDKSGCIKLDKNLLIYILLLMFLSL